MITQDELHKLLEYLPETGEFFWKVSRTPTISIGQRAGYQNKGYWFISINKIKYGAHRLAWFYMMGTWPTGMIDHINGDPSDNRWCNLRDADYQQNQFNRGATRKNTSGYKGVTKDRQWWKAQIMYNQKQLHLGLFDSLEEAAKVYQDKAKELYGDFYHD